MIIGLPFMWHNHCVLDVRQGIVTVNGVSVKAIRVPAPDPDSRVRRYRITDKRDH